MTIANNEKNTPYLWVSHCSEFQNIVGLIVLCVFCVKCWCILCLLNKRRTSTTDKSRCTAFLDIFSSWPCKQLKEKNTPYLWISLNFGTLLAWLCCASFVSNADAPPLLNKRRTSTTDKRQCSASQTKKKKVVGINHTYSPFPLWCHSLVNLVNLLKF